VQHAGGVDRVTCSGTARGLYEASLRCFLPCARSAAPAPLLPRARRGRRRGGQSSAAALCRVFDVAPL